MKEKNGSLQKRIFCGLTALATAAMVFPTTAMAAVDESDVNVGAQVITVEFAEDGASGIQDAIDYLATNNYYDGWTIEVGAGTYNDFNISQEFSNLTVSGESEASVIVETLIETAADGTRDSGGINAYGNNTTIENMTLTAGTAAQPSFAAAVSAHDGAVGGADISLTVQNCTITGSGMGTGLLFDCPSFSVIDCDISGFEQAIEFYGDNFTVGSVNVTGNTISNSSFAFHGYFGKASSNPGTILFSGNTITGTDSLRSKVVIQDNSNGDGTSSMRVNVTGNTLSNALIGLVMLDDPGEIVTPVLENNIFGASSFYVEAVYPGSIDLFTTFQAPENSNGYWVTNLTEADIGSTLTAEGLAYIRSQIEEANARGDTSLSITGIDSEHLVETFTLFKDGIYWVSTEKSDLPSMDKEALTGEENGQIGDVNTNDVIEFELNSNLPANLGLADTLVFSDQMSGLVLVSNSIQVYIGSDLLDSTWYTVDYTPTSGATFTVSINLSDLYDAGIIDSSDLSNATSVVVTYDATVTATTGLVENEAWVNDSTHDIVTGTVGGGDTPETGGTGTTLFTIGGGAMLAAAGTLFVISRRKGNR